MSKSDRNKGGFFDKIGLGGSAKPKKGGVHQRPYSESDFNEYDEIAPVVPLTAKQVEECFLKMLDDMNLTEEKRRPLLEQPLEKKRHMLAMWQKGYNTNTKSKLDTPGDYINALQRANLENLSGAKISHIVESLRITLTNNPVSWVQEFGPQGLRLVLDLLNECYTAKGPGAGGSPEQLSKIQVECLRCLRAVMNNTAGLKQVVNQKEVFALVSRSLDPSRPNVMQEAAKLLSAVCILHDLQGHERVLEAITISAENKGLDRFFPIVQGLAKFDNDSLRASCMTLINAIVNSPEDFEYRIYLRNEFMRAGLYSLIDDLNAKSSGDLQTQVEVFLKNKEEDYEEFSDKFDSIHTEFDDSRECYNLIQNLVADTPADPLFLAILQHLLCIRDDNLVRTAYFKLIEECVAQIVLHRSGYDPDFRAKKFEIDVEGLTGLVIEKLKSAKDSKNNELNAKLEEALTQKQVAEAENENLKKRVAELERTGGTVKDNLAVTKEAIEANLKLKPQQSSIPPAPPMMSSGGGPPAPPPPPPPPMMGFGGPPPPPPMMGFGGPPPPPMPGGFKPPPAPGMPKMPEQLPYGMKPKKKWKNEVQFKKANWKTIQPQKLSEKSFWVKVEEDKLASEDILTGLQRFSVKPLNRAHKDDGDKVGVLGGKKVRELRILDPKSAQNLSILLNGLLKHMSYESVRNAILRCDETILSGTILEQMINYLPPPDQLKRLEELYDQYDNLSEAEQFAVTISTVKRLVPRLRSLKFKLLYPDTVQDIKPGIVAATAACEEIKSSKLFSKLLELVLLLGNVMNSGSLNGQALGFEISYLPKLVNTKDAENRQTLLHYITETVEAKFPDVLRFDEELIHLDKAARVSVESIQKSLRLMDADLRNLETDLKTSKVPQGPDDHFFDVMSTFSKEARQQYDILAQMFSKIDSLYTELAEYFAFDKSKYTVEEFLGDIKTFKDQFQQAYKDNLKQREAEEKLRRANEAKIKAEQEKAERLARKKALVDMNVGDDIGVMDNLLEALKTGQAFQRPDQKRKRTRPGDPKAPLNRSRSRSNIMVLSPSSRELITDIPIDSENTKPTRSQNKRRSSRDDQADDLLRRLREL